jgi:hypothetical protein
MKTISQHEFREKRSLGQNTANTTVRGKRNSIQPAPGMTRLKGFINACG